SRPATTSVASCTSPPTPPPPLCPYTTLFRSRVAHPPHRHRGRSGRPDTVRRRQGLPARGGDLVRRGRDRRAGRDRTGDAARRQGSEEHTSELQSRENLVCRLLPETKKHLLRR